MGSDVKIGVPGYGYQVGQGGQPQGNASQKPEKVAHDFESFMILTVLKELEKTTSLSKKGYSEKTYMSIVYEKVAECLADKGIGIKQMLTKYSMRGSVKVPDPKGDNTGK
jgi:Rod binding domain-containing protein